MNKAHHGQFSHGVGAADVAQCDDDLGDLLELVEQMYEECYRWRRRDAPGGSAHSPLSPAAPPALLPVPTSVLLNVLVCTRPCCIHLNIRLQVSRKHYPERLDPHLLDSTVTLLPSPTQLWICRPGRFACDRRGGPREVAADPAALPSSGMEAQSMLGASCAGSNAGLIEFTATKCPIPRTRTPKTILLLED